MRHVAPAGRPYSMSAGRHLEWSSAIPYLQDDLLDNHGAVASWSKPCATVWLRCKSAYYTQKADAQRDVLVGELLCWRAAGRRSRFRPPVSMEIKLNTTPCQ